MKCTFIITIALACLCNYINGQGGFPVGTTAPPLYNGGVGLGGGGAGAGGGFGGGIGSAGGNGFGVNNQGGQPDYGYGTPVPHPTYQPGSSMDDSYEDSTTINPNGLGDGANAQQSMSGGGQFALGFVAVLLVVGCAVVLVFLVRRKRAQAMKDHAPVTSA